MYLKNMARRSHHSTLPEMLHKLTLHAMSNGNMAAHTLAFSMSIYGFFSAASNGWKSTGDDSYTATKACSALLYGTAGSFAGVALGLVAKQAYIGLSYLLLGSTHSSAYEVPQSVLIGGAMVVSGLYGAEWKKAIATTCAVAIAGLAAERLIG